MLLQLPANSRDTSEERRCEPAGNRELRKLSTSSWNTRAAVRDATAKPILRLILNQCMLDTSRAVLPRGQRRPPMCPDHQVDAAKCILGCDTRLRVGKRQPHSARNSLSLHRGLT